MNVLAILLISAAISLVGLVVASLIYGASAVISAVIRVTFWVVGAVLRLVVVSVIRLFYAVRGVVARLR